MKSRFLAFLCAVCLLVTAAPAAGALTGETTRAADTLYTLGLLSREADNLTAAATRGDAVTLLVALAGCEAEAAADNWISGFRDVPAALQTAVNYASHQNWTSGTTVLTFSPDSPVTANAWFSFLLRMLGYSDKSGDFDVAGAAVFAQRIGLTPRHYEGTLTLGELYESARDALSFSYKDGSETVAERLVRKSAVSRSAANALGLLTPELSARQIADRYTAAVFQIALYRKPIEIDAQSPSADASGFFISSDGLAVTNYHSLEDAIYATVTLSTGEVYPIDRVLYYDQDIDLAVIRVSRTSTEGRATSAFACLTLAEEPDVRAGDTAYSIGSPLGLGLSVSAGIISDPSRVVKTYSQPCIMNTADISRGSSGGALLNVYGQVIGVTSGAYAYGNSMYLAVPIAPVLTADLSGEGWTVAEVTEMVQAANAEDSN